MVAADGSIHHPMGVGEVPPHQGLIDAPDIAVGQGIDQHVIRQLGAGNGKEPRRAHVETVHDAGSVALAHRGQLGEPSEQPVHHRALGVTGTGMHHQAGRLVDDDQVFVGMDDGELDRGISLGSLRLRQHRRLYLHPLPGL